MKQINIEGSNLFALFCSVLLIITLQLSCKSSKNLVDPSYQSSIEAYRESTETGLTVGERAPLAKADLSDLRYFPLDTDYKVDADVVLLEGETPFELPTYSGITKTYIKYASLHFKVNGQNQTLYLYKNLQNLRMPQYKDLLFLPYKDVSNSDSTYGGGRYINIYTYDIEDGKTTLDFNKSYNPWCVYSDGYNCPIPPLENHMDIEIIAGEMNFAGKRKS